MSLQCNVTVFPATYSGGPPPNVFLQVYNPNAVAVVVTAVSAQVRPLNGGTVNTTAATIPVFPTGPGQTVSVPALSSITMGPVQIAVGSAANANSNETLIPLTTSTFQPSQFNTQPSQPARRHLMIGAVVYGSDGSVNTAGEAGLLVSFPVRPFKGSQGGVCQFARDNNTVLAGCI